LNRTEDTGDEEHDIVEIGVIVETADPRLIRWARVRDGRKRQECDDQTDAHEAMKNHDVVTVGRQASLSQA